MNTEDKTTAATMVELEALIDEFLRAVSFQEGGRPSYDRIRDLFIDGGKLIKNSSDSPEISSVDEFIVPRQALVDSGEMTFFEEVEIAGITEVFGNIAHRLSTYEKRGMTNGKAFRGIGVISTQFIRTPGGWKMSSMAWDDERPGLAVPDRYK
jgi:hypothetical protein